MADATFSNTIVVTAASVSGGTLTFTSATEFGSGGSYGDTDASDTVTAVDTFPYAAPGNTYAGHTVTIDGRTYALFTYTHLPGSFLIPHNGELDPSDFTPGMAAVTQEGVPVANCFAADTGIATPRGELRVDALRPGDRVLTVDGRDVEVLWIGRQTLPVIAGLPPQGDLVRIAAGALEDGVPHCDLTVTPDHALLLEGCLVTAATLVNGHSVRLLPAEERTVAITVYHVETESHEVLLANGAPAESLVDAAGRQGYDNYAEYLERFGTDRPIPEMPLPRIAGARLLPRALRARQGADTARWPEALSL